MPILRLRNCRASVLAMAAFFAAASAPRTSARTSITTYHYDNNRTGWNSTETVLTPANVGRIACRDFPQAPRGSPLLRLGIVPSHLGSLRTQSAAGSKFAPVGV